MLARSRMPMLAERWTLVQNRIAPTLAAALGRGWQMLATASSQHWPDNAMFAGQ